MSQPTLNNATPALNYAAPDPPRVGRVASFVLFFLQCNAVVVMIMSGWTFWWQLTASVQEALKKGRYGALLREGGIYSTVPFMLAAGVWALCLIARRR
jgi:uncharacterized iron-regulated membrane protein